MTCVPSLDCPSHPVPSALTCLQSLGKWQLPCSEGLALLAQPSFSHLPISVSRDHNFSTHVLFSEPPLKDFRALGHKATPGCLVLGDLGGRRVAQSLRPMVEVVGCGSGLAGWYIKGLVSGKLFTLCGNCLTLGGAVCPGSASPQLSKHQKMKKTKNTVNTHLLLLSIPFSSFEARPDSTSLEKAVVREGLSSDLFPRTQHKL